jgi:hypothetical protein
VDFSLIISIIGLALSVVATVMSLFILARQTVFLRQSNHIPISVDLAQEFRSDSFLESQDYVINKLRQEHGPDLGVSGLPADARKAVDRVTSYFTGLGALAVQRMLDEPYAVTFMGYRANRAWSELEPYIIREREIRGDSDYLVFFEDLICRIRDHWPPTQKYGFKLRSLPSIGQAGHDGPA